MLFGDFSEDGQIDVADIMEVASKWRCKCGDGCYDSRYDLDKDGDIDIVDIMLVVANWGDTSCAFRLCRIHGSFTLNSLPNPSNRCTIRVTPFSLRPLPTHIKTEAGG